MLEFGKRRQLLAWQFAYLVLATTWLWAPQLNHGISYRVSLISQYETGGQPYAWLFRLGDILAAVLLGLMARYLIKMRHKVPGILLLIIAVCSFLDPVLTTSCHVVGSACVEYFSLSFVLHAAETILAALAVFTLAGYDVWRRRRLVSALFVIFQVAYGAFSFTEYASQNSFNTLSQVVYQTFVVVWPAWYCRESVSAGRFRIRSRESRAVRYVAAGWGVLNSFLAITVSLYHGGVFGRIEGLYFGSGSELLAQHGVVVGVVMLYLSRHLLRGEERARQIFLALVGGEVIKYSVITPHDGLLAFYFLSFCALFVLNDDFDRGTVPMRLKLRLQEALYVFAGLTAIGASLLAILYATHRRLTANSIDHFFDYTVRPTVVHHINHRSQLVAHLITAFVISGLAIVLWTLFRPIRPKEAKSADTATVGELLEAHSRSSEDYFKLWPADKQYFWSKKGDGFIAYRIVGPVVFGLPDPITAPARRQRLAGDFIKWARAHRLTVCMLPVYGETSRSLYEKNNLQTLQIGSSAMVQTDAFVKKTSHNKWWRWQKNRAIRAGYEYAVAQPPHSAAFIRKLSKVSKAWLKVGGHEERGFALGYFDNDYLMKCTVHYLQNAEGELVAFTNELPRFGRVNTASIDLLRYLPDANNSMPFLLANLIQNLHEQGIKQFDLGFVPFAASDEAILKIAKILASGQFSSAGLEQFKNKFEPEWQPTYLAYDGDLADLARIAINLEGAMKLTPENA